MRKTWAKNYKNYCESILKYYKKPISYEVFVGNQNSMLPQVKKIRKLGKNDIKLNTITVYTIDQVKKS